jgi:transposase
MTPKRGGRWRDHRPVLNGIVFRTRAGIPWRDLPERSGPWETVDKRFARWQTDGTWARIEAALGTQADGAGELDWNAQIDAGVIRAHQHAAGARNGGSRRSRQATSRRWDGHGWADHQAPYHLRRPGPQPGHPPHSGPGRRHPAVDRVGGSGAGGAAWCPGRPRKRREHLTGDKAYSSRANRQALRARRIPHTILSGTTSRPTGPVGVLGVAGRRPLTGSATASATRSSG